MPINNLRIDTFSVVYDLLKSWAVEEFWEFKDCVLTPGSVYVVGRKQTVENIDRVRYLAKSPDYTVVFDGAAEGSWTLEAQLKALGLTDLATTGKLLVLGGGDMSADFAYMSHDHFINVFLGYEHNTQEMTRMDEVYNNNPKPYKFLFLNGRSRPHRKYLWHCFEKTGLLDSAVWTMLDPRPILNPSYLSKEALRRPAPIRRLPPEYEYQDYKTTEVVIHHPRRQFIKHEMFANTWGEVYLQCEPYRDTYFSLVTETVFGESNCSFRTEKIVKPIAMGHPWICAANFGYYRDLRNLGFQTFGHVIDESFDLIDNPQDRIDRIVAIVEDLCEQDLASFLKECYTICKYNQQHLKEYREQLRQTFPDRFCKFLQQYQ